MNQMIRTATQLGAHIQEARLRAGISQQQLAEMIGKHQKTISSIEQGNKGTKLETLLLVLAALDLNMEMSKRSKASPDIADIF
ncbi:helix-turn-helix transcriptional regulator [Sphingopyxis sp.]|uniref:helix-turn-helix domain-containing protein n=1 Tax=Sphingopyxis sp. TaxID=1908224 RepID=UPI0025CFE6C8|nr:helix-turn-helix transcriptional regulator [Sphingopyxis sp.]MBK6413262.1 helix-turn-helix domain-containing protein [Sphingopyxis sp.]